MARAWKELIALTVKESSAATETIKTNKRGIMDDLNTCKGVCCAENSDGPWKNGKYSFVNGLRIRGGGPTGEVSETETEPETESSESDWSAEAPTSSKTKGGSTKKKSAKKKQAKKKPAKPIDSEELPSEFQTCYHDGFGCKRRLPIEMFRTVRNTISPHCKDCRAESSVRRKKIKEDKQKKAPPGQKLCRSRQRSEHYAPIRDFYRYVPRSGTSVLYCFCL